jgi:3',5'-cyclic AMP phosphodiesterase CpdA
MSADRFAVDAVSGTGIAADATPAAVTLLQVSDMQFGGHHHFGKAGLSEGDRRYDQLVNRLLDDLESLRERHGLAPDLIVVPGDLAEAAMPAEYEQVHRFLTDLASGLRLDARRVVTVPGNHDVNWFACQAYLYSQLAVGKLPEAPYRPKWDAYSALLTRLRGTPLEAEEPWQIMEFPDLGIVIAAFNSTMEETHEVHRGHLGECQIQWFLRELRRYQGGEWLRIGVLHHNPVRSAGDDNSHLVDVDLFTDRLASMLDLVLHGHTHETRLAALGPDGLPVLGVGSAGVETVARAPEVPNQYQLVRITGNAITVYARRYDQSRRRWIGDNGIGLDGDDWHRTITRSGGVPR